MQAATPFRFRRELPPGALGVAMNLPTLLTLGLVLAYPIYYAAYLSFHKVSLAELRRGVFPFVGLANYQRIFNDRLFLLALKNTLIFTAFSVTVEIVLAIAIALLIDQRHVWTSRITKFLILVPYAVPPIAAAAVSALALAGLPARAAPAGPVRQSLAAFSADPGKAAALRRGVAAMKALPGSDHRSWFFQAAVHAYSDALFEAELKRDPKLKSIDGDKYWNKCPHFGQCSADFVIWHRAYLHFFERTLRAAAGDPSLALPYWNYGDPEQRTFPAIYAPEFVDAEKTIAIRCSIPIARCPLRAACLN